MRNRKAGAKIHQFIFSFVFSSNIPSIGIINECARLSSFKEVNKCVESIVVIVLHNPKGFQFLGGVVHGSWRDTDFGFHHLFRTLQRFHKLFHALLVCITALSVTPGKSILHLDAGKVELAWVVGCTNYCQWVAGGKDSVCY